MHIYVDADACPVKEIIIEEAGIFGVSVTLVSSIAHFSTKAHPEHVRVVYVDTGAEAADYKLLSFVRSCDILITQDYGLASLALPKGTRVLNQKGYAYTTENIDALLQQRYFSALQRNSGQRTKGPKPFTSKDKDTFRLLFQRVLHALPRPEMPSEFEKEPPSI